MASIGGSVESVSISGRRFAVAADADTQRDLGGVSNAVEPNGDGSGRLIKTRKSPMFEGLVLEIDDDRGDQEYLQAKANEPGFFAVAVTYASGRVYQGLGQIVDDIKVSSNAATATVSIAGTGVFTAQ